MQRWERCRRSAGSSLHGGIMVSALLVLTTSILALRTRVLPAWLAWAGLVVAPLTLLAPFFSPVLVFFAWVLVVSVLLLTRARGARAGATAGG